MNDIETERLVLKLVSLAGLAAIAAEDEEACSRIIGALPREWFEDAWVAELRPKSPCLWAEGGCP